MKAALAALVIMGCGSPMPEITDSPVVEFAQARAAVYFGRDVPIRAVYSVSSDLIISACGHLVAGCNRGHHLWILETLAPTETCQTILHELGHSAAFYAVGDWDALHLFYADFYNSYVFSACENMP